ncbi:MAG: Smr/MutS family protein [Flavobacteriaceae bacterium]|nr:Smr/MutS family protein [Flavobacteriaceae bacterium]
MNFTNFNQMDIEIDLHGLTYNEVHEVLMNKVILHYNKGNIPIRIITGKSEKMKTIVREQCKKHNFKVNDSWDGNPGVLIIS